MCAEVFVRYLLIPCALLLSGCAIVHQYQMDSIDSDMVLKGKKFEIIVSETGVNLQEATSTAKLFTRDAKTQNQMQAVNNVVSMFQMGPRTGNMVFNDKYADGLFKAIQIKCPSGKVSGVSSVRETAKYPIVSGEIVRITGYCGES